MVRISQHFGLVTSTPNQVDLGWIFTKYVVPSSGFSHPWSGTLPGHSDDLHEEDDGREADGFRGAHHNQLGVVAIGSGVVSMFQHPSFTGLTLSFWLITGYLAVFATMFAAVCSVLLLGEHLSIVSMVGGVCIVVAMLWGRRLA
jgi:hypothetical protein